MNMNFFINQNIVIQQLRIEGLSNSSVLQIGSAGMIKPLSQLYNTGGFTGPAPAAGPGITTGTTSVGVIPPVPYVPLVSPSG